MSFASSKLGTKEYWDNVYDQEVQNYNDHGDIGEVWFGEYTAKAVSKWISSNVQNMNADILDLGSGNGYLLQLLAEKGFTHLLGVDYSEKAVALAQKIAKDENLSIQYKVDNIMASDIDDSFDIVCDRGTFDAISLLEGVDLSIYITQVAKWTVKKGLFIITSCNWTEDELRNHFNEHFTMRTAIQAAPQFTFGGVQGNATTTLVFERT
eukprot:GCRY01006873.1.p1 GENE.GCRY01006873.1~~GCRY01006873.1.p1  ORF type:complete len:209 (+),score=36.77 GCRY01006873.1:35-661(+)